MCWILAVSTDYSPGLYRHIFLGKGKDTLYGLFFQTVSISTALQEHTSTLGENSSHPTQSPRGVAYSVICLVSAACFPGISKILPQAWAASSLALFQTETDHQRYMPLLNSSIVRCSNDYISCVTENKLLKNSI